jgi:hypothetical protein
MQKMQAEMQFKQQIMEQQFQYDLQLAQAGIQTKQQLQTEAEDRKDKRTKIQATQQSELIDQRKNNAMPKDFESQDDLAGMFGM